MKNKDIVNMIKQQTSNIAVPDLSQKIINSHVDNIVIMEEKNTQSVYKKNWLKVLLPTLASGIIVLIIVLILPLILKDSGDTPINVDEKIITMTHTKEIYGVQVTSLFGFTSLENDANELNIYKNLLKAENEYDRINYTEEDYQIIANEINYYFNTVLEFLNKDNNSYILYELSEGKYKYKMDIILSFDNIETKYTMYFNEEVINERDKDDDIDEVSTRLEGYIELGDVKYTIIGEKEVEDDECEIEFRLNLSEDGKTYLIVSQEVETSENEYFYKYVVDGKVIEELEVSREEEGGAVSVEVSVAKSNINSEYEFSYLDDKIKVDFEYLNFKGTVIISIVADEYIYKFNEENIIVISKNKNKKIYFFSIKYIL